MIHTKVFFILLSLSLVSVLSNGFSIHYAYDEGKNHAAVIRPANRPIQFAEKPSPEQVLTWMNTNIMFCLSFTSSVFLLHYRFRRTCISALLTS